MRYSVISDFHLTLKFDDQKLITDYKKTDYQKWFD
jgi:hypothetical protein